MRLSVVLLISSGLTAFTAFCYLQSTGEAEASAARVSPKPLSGALEAPNLPAQPWSSRSESSAPLHSGGVIGERSREGFAFARLPAPVGLAVMGQPAHAGMASPPSRASVSSAAASLPTRAAVPPPAAPFPSEPVLPPMILAAAPVVFMPGAPRGRGTPAVEAEPPVPAPLPAGLGSPAPGLPSDDARQQRIEQLRDEFTQAIGDPDEVTPDGRDYAQRFVDATTLFDQQFIAIYGYEAYAQQQAWVVQHDSY